MEKRNFFIYPLQLILLSALITGVLISIFLTPAIINLDYVLIGLLLLPVMIYLGFVYRGSMALFILFCCFGVMNTSVKPFDLLFVLVGGLFLIGKKGKLEVLRQMRFINLCFFIFILVSLLSLFNSTDMHTGLSYLINTIFVIIIFYFLAITIQKEKEFKSILTGYIYTVLFSVAVVILEKMGIIGFVGTWFQGVRAQGFFLDPNDFSPFLVLAIILLLEKAFSYRYASLHYLAYISLAGVTILILLAAMSRAAVLDLGIALGLYLIFTIFYKKKYGQVFVLILLSLVIAALVFVVAGDSITHYLSMRFLGSTTVFQDYDTDRFHYQYEGILMGSTHLFGIGPGQFEILFAYATHNLFVRIIAENGWIAFLSFVGVIFYVLALLIRYRKWEVWNLPIYLFLSVFLGTFVNSFFLDTLHWRYLWFLLGLCTLVINQANLKRRSKVA
jgi:hypothetical protein